MKTHLAPPALRYWRRLATYAALAAPVLWGLGNVLPVLHGWPAIMTTAVVVAAAAVRTRLQRAYSLPFCGLIGGYLIGHAFQTGTPETWAAGVIATLTGPALFLALGRHSRLRPRGPSEVYLRFTDGVEIPMTTLPYWCPTEREWRHRVVAAHEPIPLEGKSFHLHVQDQSDTHLSLVIRISADGTPYCPPLAEMTPSTPRKKTS